MSGHVCSVLICTSINFNEFREMLKPLCWTKFSKLFLLQGQDVDQWARLEGRYKQWERKNQNRQKERVKERQEIVGKKQREREEEET